jgi:hypothetical protein
MLHFISTDEDPGLRIESFAVINLRGVSTNKTIICFIAMQTYKELSFEFLGKGFCFMFGWEENSVNFCDNTYNVRGTSKFNVSSTDGVLI